MGVVSGNRLSQPDRGILVNFLDVKFFPFRDKCWAIGLHFLHGFGQRVDFVGENLDG